MENTVTPWAWYISRASALVGFLLLYISIFLGTVSGLPWIKRYFLRLRSLNFHCWISVQAFLFATIHGVSLLFDKFMHFSLAQIFVPFASDYQPGLVALGTISFYLMIILIMTSYARKFFSYNVWRTLHFLNIALYLFSIVHAIYLGSDLKVGILRNIFIYANVFLIILLLINLIYKIWSGFRGKQFVSVVNNFPENNANLRQSDSAVGQERSRENFRRRV
jgi:methionine sulfoxide reductase heme-binding subunit